MSTPRNDKDDRRAQAADAAGHLVRGVGHFWRAARVAASGIRKEIDRSNASKTIDDAGRELSRAVTNVVRRLGVEIDKAAGAGAEPPSQSASGGKQPWPKTREEYEKTYGPISGDWPKSPEEYEKRYGVPPHEPGNKPKGPTPSDPGFHIAIDDDKKPR